MNKPQQQQKKVRTAITPTREDDFPGWYQSAIKEADLAENSPVRGCMVIKPYGYAIWENIQRALDDMVKEAGVQNAYFPLLIPLEFISREAEHVDGFAKECAVVTHHRLEKNADGTGLIPAEAAKLEEPYVIRPTSETIIGHSMSKWIQSYRDLPMKLNQWCNIMRWEMRTRLFLRTSEFLWQEGHNAFATAKEANDDARKMLDIYKRLYVEFLAMPGLEGEKTADERFPGAIHTYTYESMMQDGKALQACTSHDLGDNFAKSFEIQFQGEDGNVHNAFTTSWGLSTRSVGGLIMTHGDDDGIILPPKIAPHQIVVLPITKDEDRAEVLAYCESLKAKLKDKNIRVHVDERDMRPADKMWDWVKKGVPLRVEVGKRDIDGGNLVHTRRDIGRDSKTIEAEGAFLNKVNDLLDQIQADMCARASKFEKDNTQTLQTSEDIDSFYANKGIGFIKTSCKLLESEAFQKVMKTHSLTPRCVPFEDNNEFVIIGKSY
jgi:prolyl-tRNA synthetase